ncbi:hypothetical protein TNCV_2729451 [Trichonephila clavipes]|nr:hypothetical protein TNCV_2729451 [Trichonephila clavipes]
MKIINCPCSVCTSGSTVFEKSGKVFLTTPVEENRRPPSVMKTFKKVRKLISSDRRLIVRMMADELPINPESVRQIISQNLGIRKACCLVPHHLTGDQKQDLHLFFVVEMAEATPNFLNCFVTQDESWWLRYAPETKRKSRNSVLLHYLVG